MHAIRTESVTLICERNAWPCEKAAIRARSNAPRAPYLILLRSLFGLASDTSISLLFSLLFPHRSPCSLSSASDDPTPVPNTNLCLFTPTVGERGRIVRGGLRGLLEPSPGRHATRASGGATDSD